MNYEKITAFLIFIASLLLFLLLNEFNSLADYKLIANEKVNLLENTASNFEVISLIICALLWVWSNFVIIKTKQYFWLFLPFVFMCFCVVCSCKMSNEIFSFKKQNGLWNGSFSVTYIAGIFGILLTGIALLINYLTLKKVISK